MKDSFKKKSYISEDEGAGYAAPIIDLISSSTIIILSFWIIYESLKLKVPDDNIDLIIRTGGDKRLSNFLLFQAAYAEIMFIDTLWPDFTRDDFAKCLDSFKKVNRRFGKRI